MKSGSHICFFKCRLNVEGIFLHLYVCSNSCFIVYCFSFSITDTIYILLLKESNPIHVTVVIIRTCACWAHFVATLTSTEHIIYLLIIHSFIYLFIQHLNFVVTLPGDFLAPNGPEALADIPLLITLGIFAPFNFLWIPEIPFHLCRLDNLIKYLQFIMRSTFA